MSEELEQLGQRVRQVREALGLSRETLAEAAKTSASTVKRLENGEDIRVSGFLAITRELSRRGAIDIGLDARIMSLSDEGQRRVLDLIQWYESRTTGRSR